MRGSVQINNSVVLNPAHFIHQTLPNIRMKLKEVISNLDNINEESFLYVKKVNQEFSIDSETVVLELNEEEMEWKTNEVTERKCPGFEYFMEVFLIKEFMEDLSEKDYPTINKKIERLIHYAEFDA